MEPVSTLTAAANTPWSEANADLAFRKFVESGAGELAKKFTESAIAKMDNSARKSGTKCGENRRQKQHSLQLNKDLRQN
ncbi:hypothetical protein [Myxacorys almedinensis]|uniref:Uncharacterized protein n=1 Tax=Myxacorys almedinensis A TaxID=2690445 RepID=A0A8J7YWI8_9CYAN|nr:hypothetical protein [Myxacorys almedinensis]NDJ15937.1 hypothetical protein [Myxacorys almedinensis A]